MIVVDNICKVLYEVGMVVCDVFVLVVKIVCQFVKLLGNYDLVDVYKGIVVFFIELKCMYLSGSVYEVMSYYVEKEIVNFEVKVFGISMVKFGFNVSIGMFGSVVVLVFFINCYVGVYVLVEVGGGKGCIYFVDDDGDVDYWFLV